MKLKYDSVTLNIVSTRQILRENLYMPDSQDYLYTRWLVDVFAVYNPALQDGTKSSIKDATWRKILSTPRKRLTLTDDLSTASAPVGTILISPSEVPDSPGTFFSCDAKGGPYPKLAPTIVEMHGAKTWLVHYQVETFINEMNASTALPKVVLGHRWQMTEDVDEDYYATRTVTGEVVFNMAMLVNLGTHPDDYRRDFFHPIPNMFKRDAIKVTASSDGTRIYYSFIDRQKPIQIADQRCTRIEAIFTKGIQQGALLESGARIGAHLFVEGRAARRKEARREARMARREARRRK